VECKKSTYGRFAHDSGKRNIKNCNDNAIRTVNLATSKNMIVKSTTSTRRNIRNFT
jgi:hypothetical protein